MFTEKERAGAESAPEPANASCALNTAAQALGDLHVVECAMRAAVDENNPLDRETQRVVLCHATDILLSRIRALDIVIDYLDDHMTD